MDDDAMTPEGRRTDPAGGLESGAAAAGPSLDELRQGIAEIDAALVGMLNRRASLSQAVGRLKRAGPATAEVFRPGREAELMRRLEDLNHGPLPDSHLRAIYREIFSSSRYLQRPQRVAFLGPEGTFSHLAARSLLGRLASFHPQPDLDGVFQAVEAYECDIGIVPLENSQQGSISQSFDLFMRHELFIRAETFFRVRHSLLSRERDLASVKVLCSHPQPLAQCGAWIMKHLPRARLMPMESTAAAARHAAFEPGAAAIAHVDLAPDLDLHILAQGIEDNPGNRTRFALIGKEPADRPGTDKTSLIFAVADKPGSLGRVLQCLTERDINMAKLESRPMPGEAWKYVFFADLDCDIHDERYTGVLDAMADHCLSVRVLGSYPAGM
ncbi:MAG: prephenate dehydratase [Desulfovibrio sp.]|jgi:chorismate mutase/prephenate dehydratase|nr:prephenate dehydratase [Desulfovibrio sp.]